MHLQNERAGRDGLAALVGGPAWARGDPLQAAGVHQVGVLRLRAPGQARVPGDRVTGLDGHRGPAGAAVSRGDLELALGVADRAALVVPGPAARRAFTLVAAVQGAAHVPVA